MTISYFITYPSVNRKPRNSSSVFSFFLPGSWRELVQPGGESVVVKIFETEKIGESHQLVPGTLQTDGKTYIRVAAEDGFVGICSLQAAG